MYNRNNSFGVHKDCRKHLFGVHCTHNTRFFVSAQDATQGICKSAPRNSFYLNTGRHVSFWIRCPVFWTRYSGSFWVMMESSPTSFSGSPGICCHLFFITTFTNPSKLARMLIYTKEGLVKSQFHLDGSE